MDNTPPKVSVVMPVFNEVNFISRTINSLLKQDYPPDRMEVIIADGMSTDGTREIIEGIESGQLKICLINNPHKIVSTGLNNAILWSHGEIIVRVDGHCRIAPDYIQNCVKHLTSTEIAGVGGSITTIGETPTADAIAIAMGSTFGVGDSAFRTLQDKTKFVDTVPFPAYKRGTIMNAGPFDEELIRNQDDEYNYRLRSFGAKLLLAADINSEYYSRSSLQSLWKQYFQYGYWKVRVLQKHPRQMQLRQFVPPLLVSSLVLSAILSIFTWQGLLALIFTAGLYILVNLTFSLSTAARLGWRYLLLLPIIYSCMHLSYGSGFLTGLIRFSNRWNDKQSQVPAWEDVEARLQREE